MGPLHTRGELLLQRPHGPSGAVPRLQVLFIPESRSVVTICFPASPQGDSTVVGTSKLRDLYERFEEELGRRQERAKAARPKWEPPKTKLDEDPGEWSHQGLSGVASRNYFCRHFALHPVVLKNKAGCSPRETVNPGEAAVVCLPCDRKPILYPALALFI